jgi:hypothetical protein
LFSKERRVESYLKIRECLIAYCKKEKNYQNQHICCFKNFIVGPGILSKSQNQEKKFTVVVYCSGQSHTQNNIMNEEVRKSIHSFVIRKKRTLFDIMDLKHGLSFASNCLKR